MRLLAFALFALAWPAAAETRTCLVVGIADGDTLTARCGQPGAYQQIKVRLAAIDAPESSQPFGQRSKQALSDLCYRKDAEITERDVDRYGRIVADVSCSGRDAGERQVVSGMAWVYVKYANDHSHLFSREVIARQTRAGLWAAGDPVAPWEWRKQKKERR